MRCRVVNGDVRRVVNSPDGVRYEVVGMAKDWKLGTGSVLLDAAALLWSVIRRARGKEWVVTVTQADTKSLTRLVRTREDAASSVTELSEAIESGQYQPPIG